MCGIFGLIETRPTHGPDATRAILADGARRLAHRGPDGEGVWLAPDACIGFAHRRLAIIDPTPAGTQPMTSASGRLTVTFNGEIYNYRDLKAELEAAGTVFASNSDTEVLLEAVESWGLAATLERLNGMFAFALHDARDDRVTLARDRFGQKPLYLANLGGGAFAFASQPGALRAVPAFAPELSATGVSLLLRFSNIPSPHTIWENVEKLSPGCHLTLARDGEGVWRRNAPTAYWSTPSAALTARATTAGAANAVSDDDALEALLTDAVGTSLVADAPLGAFLSGGVDSSLVVALMGAHTTHSVRTFSIGFREADFDESAYAAEVAAKLGTEHTTVTLSEADALDVVPDLPGIYDEPFADFSQLPTTLLARVTREHVTVALTGDGGDELFGGYARYRQAERLGAVLDALPAGMQGLLGNLLGAAPTLSPWPSRLADRLAKLGHVLSLPDRQALYRDLMSHWWSTAALTREAVEAKTVHDADWTQADDLSPLRRHMLLDTVDYLERDILAKVDRAAMAASLETRLPLLDHRVFQYAWSLPDAALRDSGGGKAPLRRLLARHLPPHLVERPKMGFGIPLGDWLRGELREWAEALLSEAALRETGLLEPAPIRRAWHEHLSGRRNWASRLWCVLVLQQWLESERTEASTQKAPA